MISSKDRWGFILYKNNNICFEWYPSGVTKILVYNSPDASLPVAYQKNHMIVRIKSVNSNITSSLEFHDFEKYCENKYKIDLIALAILDSY